MPDLSKILDLLKLAGGLVGSLSGTPLIGLAVGAAEGAMALAKRFKEINNLEDSELDAELERVADAVTAHANSTIGSLD